MDEFTFGSVCSGVECASIAFLPLGWKCAFVSEVQPFPCAVLQQKFNATPPIHPLDPNEDGIKPKEKKERKSWLKIINKMPQIGDLPNEGDFRKIGKKYEGKIDLLIGGTPCFAAGTMVLTPKGYVPIESLNVGDDIISGSGKIQKVEAIGSKIAEVGDFRVLGRPIISCTPNHQWFAIEMKRDNIRTSETYAHKIPVGDYRKVVASEVKGQYIGRMKVSSIAQPKIPKVNNATERDVIELAGWYAGAGYTYHSKTKNSSAVVFTLCDAKKIKIFQSTFKDKINFSLARDGRITIYNEIFANWLEEHFGRLSLNKRIPYWLYSSSYKEDFLKGYFITDGCENEHLYRYTTTSKALAYGVADLLEDACVCFTKVASTTIIQGRTVNQHDYYNIHKYKNKTIRTKRIKDRFASVARGFKNVGIARVFNITVSEEHSYIAEGLWSANCQDLSIAGKRLGFQGKRSSLALDFIKLAYESKTKWIVWQNVPGALSSNNGKDFSTFLSGLTGNVVNTPEEGWGNSGFIPNTRIDRFGVAWRILDAQYTRTPNFPYAVPQRRRRIFLVGYFGDWRRAAQVLFEPKILQGYLEPCRKTREEVARDIRDCIDRSGECCKHTGRKCIYSIETTNTIGNETSHVILNTAYNIATCDANGTRKDRPNGGLYVYKTEASKTLSASNPNTETVIVNREVQNICYTKEAHPQNSVQGQGYRETDVAKTLDTTVPEPPKNQGGIAILQNVKCFPSAGFGQREENNVASTILTDHDNRVTSDNAAFICYPINSMTLNKKLKDGDRQTTGIGNENDPCPTISTAHHHAVSVIAIDGDKIGKNERKGGSGFGINEDQVMYTQTVKDVHAVAYNEEKALSKTNITVRRLMPIETERLMGLPDNHTRIAYNGASEEDCPDSPRYKACGNGFCTNCVEWIGRRIVLVEREIERDEKDKEKPVHI